MDGSALSSPGERGPAPVASVLVLSRPRERRGCVHGEVLASVGEWEQGLALWVLSQSLQTLQSSVTEQVPEGRRPRARGDTSVGLCTASTVNMVAGS